MRIRTPHWHITCAVLSGRWMVSVLDSLFQPFVLGGNDAAQPAWSPFAAHVAVGTFGGFASCAGPWASGQQRQPLFSQFPDWGPAGVTGPLPTDRVAPVAIDVARKRATLSSLTLGPPQRPRFSSFFGPIAAVTTSDRELKLRHLHRIWTLWHNFKRGGSGKGCRPHLVEDCGVTTKRRWAGRAGWEVGGTGRRVPGVVSTRPPWSFRATATDPPRFISSSFLHFTFQSCVFHSCLCFPRRI